MINYLTDINVQGTVDISGLLTVNNNIIQEGNDVDVIISQLNSSTSRVYGTGNLDIEAGPSANLDFLTNGVSRYFIDLNGNHDFKTGTATFGGEIELIKNTSVLLELARNNGASENMNIKFRGASGTRNLGKTSDNELRWGSSDDASLNDIIATQTWVTSQIQTVDTLQEVTDNGATTTNTITSINGSNKSFLNNITTSNATIADLIWRNDDTSGDDRDIIIRGSSADGATTTRGGQLTIFTKIPDSTSFANYSFQHDVFITPGNATINGSVTATDFIGLLNGFNTSGVDGGAWGYIPVVKSDGVIELGRYIDFTHTSNSSEDYAVRLQTDGSTDNALFIAGDSRIATVGTANVFTNTNTFATNISVGHTNNPAAILDVRTVDGNTDSIRVGRSDSSSYWRVNHAGGDFRLFNTDGLGSDVIIGLDAGGNAQQNYLGINIEPTEALHVNSNTVNGTFIRVDNSTFGRETGIKFRQSGTFGTDLYYDDAAGSNKGFNLDVVISDVRTNSILIESDGVVQATQGLTSVGTFTADSTSNFNDTVSINNNNDTGGAILRDIQFTNSAQSSETRNVILRALNTSAGSTGDWGGEFHIYTRKIGAGFEVFKFTESLFETPSNVTATILGKLKIGTSTLSVNEELFIYDTTDLNSGIRISSNSQATGYLVLGDHVSGSLFNGIWRGGRNTWATGNYLNIDGYDGISFSTGSNVFGSKTEALHISSSGSTSFNNNVNVDGTVTIIGSSTRQPAISLRAESGVTDGFSRSYIEFENEDGSNYWRYQYYPDNANKLSWLFNNTEVMTVSSTGNLTATSFILSDGTYTTTINEGTLSASNTLTLPTATGTLALISDIPTGNFAYTDVNNTFTVAQNFNADIIGPGYQTGTVTTTLGSINNVYAQAAPETGEMFAHPYLMGDLAHFETKGGTITYTGFTTAPSSLKNAFNPDASFVTWDSADYSGSEIVIELSDIDSITGLNYGVYFAIQFGNENWAPSSLKIEWSDNDGSTYTTALDSSVAKSYYYTRLAVGASVLTNIKLTFGTPSDTDIRISNIVAVDFSGKGINGYSLSTSGGTLFGNLTLSDSTYSTLLQRQSGASANNTITIPTSSSGTLALTSDIPSLTNVAYTNVDNNFSVGQTFTTLTTSSNINVGNDIDLTGNIYVGGALTTLSNNDLVISTNGTGEVNILKNTNVTGNLDVEGTGEFNETLTINNSTGTGYTHSRVILYSGNDARGAGTFSSGATAEWFWGNPYLDHDGSFVINRRVGATHNDSTAEIANTLFTLDSTGKGTFENGLEVKGANITATSLILEEGSINTYPSANTFADNLVISNKDTTSGAGITIFSDNGTYSSINFGDEQSNNVAQIISDNTGGAGTIELWTAGTQRFIINASGAATFNGSLTANSIYVPTTITVDDTIDVDQLDVNNITATGSITLNDSVNLQLGTGLDFKLYHNGLQSYIDNETGNLFIRQLVDGGLFRILASTLGGTLYEVIDSVSDGVNVDARLYYNGSEKLKTLTGGVDVTGNITVSGNMLLTGDAEVYTSGDTLSLAAGGSGSTELLIDDATGEITTNATDVKLKTLLGQQNVIETLTSSATLNTETNTVIVTATSSITITIPQGMLCDNIRVINATGLNSRTVDFVGATGVTINSLGVNAFGGSYGQSMIVKTGTNTYYVTNTVST